MGNGRRDGSVQSVMAQHFFGVDELASGLLFGLVLDCLLLDLFLRVKFCLMFHDSVSCGCSSGSDGTGRAPRPRRGFALGFGEQHSESFAGAVQFASHGVG